MALNPVNVSSLNWQETSDPNAPLATYTADFTAASSYTYVLAPVTLQNRQVIAHGMTIDNGAFGGNVVVTLDNTTPLPVGAYTRISIDFPPNKAPKSVTITDNNSTDKPLVYFWQVPLPRSVDGINFFNSQKAAAALSQPAIVECSCAVVGGQHFTLTPNSQPANSPLTNHTYFNFEVPAGGSSTGAVDFVVSPWNAGTPIKGYKLTNAGNVQLGNGDILAGALYVAAFQQALNAGLGGLLIISETLTTAALPVAIVQDIKPNGTAGSALAGGAFTDRDITALMVNTIGGPTNIASPNLTLPAGTYDVEASFQLNPNVAYTAVHRLFNTTAGAVVTDINGNHVVSLAAQSGVAGIPSTMRARFTIGVTTNLKFQTGMSVAGTAGGPASLGEPEVYLWAAFTKVA